MRDAYRKHGQAGLVNRPPIPKWRANRTPGHIDRHLGLALDCRPDARLADRLGLPVSNDKLLRAVRRYDYLSPMPPSVDGIDDRAWRPNYRYGTIICDLERRKMIALLPDHEPSAQRLGRPNSPRLRS